MSVLSWGDRLLDFSHLTFHCVLCVFCVCEPKNEGFQGVYCSSHFLVLDIYVG